MSSRVISVPQQMYLSTHNALRAGEVEYPKFDITFYDMREEQLGIEKRITLSISPLHDVQTVKRLIIKHSGLPKGTQVKDVRIIYKGVDLPNYRLMNIFASSTRRLYWSLIQSDTNADLREMGFKLPKRLQNIFNEVRLAFRNHIAPKLSIEGTGGTYFMYNLYRKKVAIFKPSDEEAFSPCNPRGYEGVANQRGFRAGVLSSEGASREVTAYLLDLSYSNFSGVPETAMIECCHPNFCYKNHTTEPSVSAVSGGTGNKEITWKAGSFQEFIDAKESCGNYDARLFSTCDVHRIGILDIFVMNLDRNDGNILVAPLSTPRDMNTPKLTFKSGVSVPGLSLKGFDRHFSRVDTTGRELLTPDGKFTKYRLIPIDHGLILPDVMDVANIDLVWFDWPQSKLPFDAAELDIIFMLDSDRDAERLKRKLFIRDECLRTMRVTARLLRIGAQMHLTLHQLAKISCREDIDTPSSLEILVKEAIAIAYQTVQTEALVKSSNRLVAAMDLAVGDIPLLKSNYVHSTHTEKPNRSTIEKDSVHNSASDREAKDIESPNLRASHPSTDKTMLNWKELEGRSATCSETKNEANTSGSLLVPSMGESNTKGFGSNAHFEDRQTNASSSSEWFSSSGEFDEGTSNDSDADSEGVQKSVYSKKVNGVESKSVAQKSLESSFLDLSLEKESEKKLSDTSRMALPAVATKQSFEEGLETQTVAADAEMHSQFVDDEWEEVPKGVPAVLERDPNDTALLSKEFVSNMHSKQSLPSTTFFVYPTNKKKKKKANRLENSNLDTGGLSHLPLPTADNLAAVGRGTRIGTARRLQGTSVRGTAYRQEMRSDNSTWSFQNSSGRIIPMNWEDQHFEKLFFDVFEDRLQRYIEVKHPKWREYVFHGNELLERIARIEANNKYRKMNLHYASTRNKGV